VGECPLACWCFGGGAFGVVGVCGCCGGVCAVCVWLLALEVSGGGSPPCLFAGCVGDVCLACPEFVGPGDVA
jgi:hypothetical protein